MPFNIEVRFLGGLTQNQQDAFDAADDYDLPSAQSLAIAGVNADEQLFRGCSMCSDRGHEPMILPKEAQVG